MSRFNSVLASLLVLLAALLTVCPASAKTLEIGQNCTYQTIQDGINAAEEGDTILIQAGTYSIDSSIIPKNNIIISGDTQGQTIIYTDSFTDCSSSSNPAMIFCNGVSGVTIHDIIFQGPAKTLQHQHENGGTTSIGGLREARNGIKIQNSKNINVYNCKFTLLLSDGIRITQSSNIDIENCIFDCAGHDSISTFKSQKVKINNCVLNQMINTCVRIYNSDSIAVTNSTFKQSMEGTGAGYIELEGRADNVAVNHNLFTASTEPVFFSAYSSGGKITVNDNALYGVENLRASYAPYEMTQANNAVFSDSLDFAEMGYGYNASSPDLISLADSWAGEADETEDLYNNSTALPENNSCEQEIGFTLSTLFDSTTANYIDYSTEQAQTASILANESTEDLSKAKLLLNGTAEDRKLGEKYLEAGQLKIQYAQELLNLSSQGLNEAKGQNNTTEQ